jgi:hypothetical protein
MKNDLGFILLSIENNEMFHNLLSSIKSFIDHNPYKQICIFNSDSDKVNTFNIPLLHIKQAKFFHGDIIVFDVLSLMLIKNFPNLKNKYFFVNSIPWEQNGFSFSEWKSLIEQDNLQIIAQNESIYDIFDICWKKPLGIGENFSYETISKFIQ